MDKRIASNKSRKKPIIKSCSEPCPIERAMRLIGGKWKGSILYHLKQEPIRFNELSRLLSGASKKMINERLKEMEQNGLITRTVISERPIAVSYELTEFGRSALVILEELRDWSQSHEI